MPTRSSFRCPLLLSAAVTACAEPEGDAPAADATTDEGQATDDGSSGELDDASATYHRDVRPLIERHCASCHVADGVSFPLSDYASVSVYREAIAIAVESQTMPPWGMADDCNEFVGDFSLDPEARDTIVAWADAGGPEGDPGDFTSLDPVPMPTLSRTDLELSVPEPYHPTLEPDDYRCFILDWPHEDPTYVTGVQFDPDNTAITHHMLLYAAGPEWVDEFQALDDADPELGYTCFGGPGNGTLPGYLGPALAVWAPGNQVGDFPEGTGLRVEPGSKLIMQVHYNTLAANGEPDQSRLQLETDPSVEREAAVLPWVSPLWRAEGGMRIAAGDPEAEHEYVATVAETSPFLAPHVPGDAPLDVLMAMHHMHQRGVAGNLGVVHPDGTEACIADLPRYDFDWQLQYRLQEPVRIRPEDELRIRCQWDNEGNDEDVFWGDGTAEEMCLGFLYVAPSAE